MALSTLSLAELTRRALAHFRVRFPGKALDPESYLGKKARAMAMLVALLQKTAEDIDHDALPTRLTSIERLDEWAILLGLPDGTGGYGRRQPRAAGGGLATITGQRGTTVADGTQLVAEDGVTIFALDGAVTLPGSAPGTASITGVIKAVTTGLIGNLQPGAALRWSSTPANIDSPVILTSALTGGEDIEAPKALLDRIVARLQQPPRGGIASDFRTWAEAADPRVVRAYPYILRGGLGTVHNVIVGQGSGKGRGASLVGTVDADVVVSDYINGSTTQEGTRPVTTQGYLTFLPYMPDYPTGGLTIKQRVVPFAARFAFDWDDSSGAGVVVDTSGWTAGPPTTVKLTGLAPATLKAAIDAGLQPRLQIASTTANAPAANPQVRVTAYSDGGGKTTLTLAQPLPAGFVKPTDGDAIYAGGPVVDSIRTAIIAYVDSLGPSRMSGYAPPLDIWEDTARIARLVQTALDQRDADDTPFAANVLATTIAVGGAAAAATDVQATDSSPLGPELLYCYLVIVTQ